MKDRIICSLNKLDGKTNDIAFEIAKKFDINQKLAELMCNRGINSIDKAEKFLCPSINDFYDPFLLSGMCETVEILKQAISDNKNIVIFGDYDADGVCASSILGGYLSSQTPNVFVYIPERCDGYGMSISAIDKIIARYKPHLIVTVDCGISCYKEIDYAKKKGVEVIVTDHHSIPSILPNCPIVNPKLSNQDYPFDNLCGAGVAFKLVHALGGKEKALGYIDLACVATIGDSVPLIDENRVIVYEGLKNLNSNPKTYMLAYNTVNKRATAWKSDDIAFYFVPQINAGGRYNSAQLAFEYLNCNELQKSIELCEKLKKLNVNRKSDCSDATAICIEQIYSSKAYLENYISCVVDNVSHGIIGIVASKIVEKFNRPTFVFTRDGDILKGSARSVAGVNLFQMLTSMKELFVSYGGHAGAAGLTLNESNYNSFLDGCREYMATLDSAVLKKSIVYDFDATKETCSLKFFYEMEKLQPFGVEFEKPIFRLQTNHVEYETLLKSPQYIKIKTDFNDLTIMNFNAKNVVDIFDVSCEKNIFFNLNENVFRGNVSLSGAFLDATNEFDVYSCDATIENLKYLETLTIKHKNKAMPTYLNDDSFLQCLDNSLSQCYGTLIVCSTKKACEHFLNNAQHKLLNKSNILEYCIVRESLTNVACNTVLYAGGIDIDFKAYKDVYFIDKVLNESYVGYLKECGVENVYELKSNAYSTDLSFIKDIKTSREIFVEEYLSFCNFALQNAVYLDLYRAFPKYKSISKQADYVSFFVAGNTFLELGILQYNRENGEYSINSKQRVNLENSVFLQNIIKVQNAVK